MAYGGFKCFLLLPLITTLGHVLYEPKALTLQMYKGHWLPIYTYTENFSAHLKNVISPKIFLTTSRLFPNRAVMAYIVFVPLWQCLYSTDHYGHLITCLLPTIRYWDPWWSWLTHFLWKPGTCYHGIQCWSPTDPPFLKTKHFFYLERLLNNYNWFQIIIKIRFLFSKYLHSLFP